MEAAAVSISYGSKVLSARGARMANLACANPGTCFAHVTYLPILDVEQDSLG